MADFATLVLQLKTAGFNASMQKASSNLTTFSKKIAGVGVALSAVSVPLALFGRSAVRGLAEFDDAMTKSLAIMSNVSDEMRMKFDILTKQLSTELPLSAKQGAESLFFLASAGLDAEQSLKALPIVAKFATAGAFDMATATDLLTDAQSALGLTVKDTAQNMKNMIMLSDLFVKGNTLANTSVQQLSEALTNEAGNAISKFNIDLKDGIATLAAFADQGIKGNVAGSLFARMIRLLGNSLLENEEVFKKYNIAIFDSIGNFRSFADIAKDLEKTLGDVAPKQRLATLKQLGFSARVAQAILPLIGFSDRIKKYGQELEKAAGITDKVVQKQLKSLGVQFQLIKNRVSVLGIELANTLSPEIKKISDSLKNMLDSLNALSPQMKRMLAITVAIGVAIAPVTLAISGITFAIGKIVGLIPEILPFLASTIKFISILSIKLIAIVSIFKFINGALRQIIERLGLSEFLTDISKKLFGVVPRLDDIIFSIKAMAIEVERWGRIFAETLISAGEFVANLGTGIGKSVLKLSKWVISNFNNVFKDIFSVAKGFAKDLGALFKELGKQIINAVTGQGFDSTKLLLNLTKNIDSAITNLKTKPIDFKGSFDELDKGLADYRIRLAKINKDSENSLSALINKGLPKQKGLIGQAFNLLDLRTIKIRKNLSDMWKKAGEEMNKAQKGIKKTMPEVITPTVSGFTEATIAGTIEAQKQAIGQTVDVNKQTADNTKEMVNIGREQLNVSRKIANNQPITIGAMA